MAHYEIEVGDDTYTGETASAKNQWDAFHIVLNCQFVLALKQDFCEQAVVLMLEQTDKKDLDRLVELLVKGKVVRDKDDVPVGMNLFQDNIAAYALLVARVVQKNLSESFSMLLSDKSNADARQQEEGQA